MGLHQRLANEGNDYVILTSVSVGGPVQSIDGGPGIDTIDASGIFAGSFSMQFRCWENDEFFAGFDTIQFADYEAKNFEILIGSNLGRNRFFLPSYNNSIELHGGSYDDSFYTSHDHADVVYGYAGNDEFSQNGGDFSYGGAGDDQFDLSWEGGLADGGPGSDLIVSGLGATIDLAAGLARGPHGPDTEVRGIENVEVWATYGYHSSIFGDAQDNHFYVRDIFDDGVASVVYRGRGGNDLLQGSLAADTIYGGSGNDWIAGYGGDDFLDGGSGNDTASYDAAAIGVNVSLEQQGNPQDTIGNGIDTLSNFENLRGSSFDDFLTGDDGANLIDGRDGDDTLRGGFGNDRLFGDAGNDAIYGGAGEDAMSGGDGDDYLDGSWGSDTIYGGAGNDTISGSSNNDFIGGNDGNDLLNGDRGADNIRGGSGTDTIDGGDGDDRIYGEEGADRISGGSGNDYILAGAGNDLVNGGFGNDFLRAGDGDDRLAGALGDDSIGGGAGNDRIRGGLGNDVLAGNAGLDTFVFDEALGAGNVDYITDFTVGDDTIELNLSIFSTLTGGALAASAFHVGSEATSADHRIIYDDTTGALFYDADGSGAGEQVQFARIGTGLALTADDFDLASAQAPLAIAAAEKLPDVLGVEAFVA